MKRESYFTERERELDIYKRAFAEGFEQGLAEVRAEAGEAETRQALVQAVLAVLRDRGLESSVPLEVALGCVRDQDRLLAIIQRAAQVENVAELSIELATSLGLEHGEP